MALNHLCPAVRILPSEAFAIRNDLIMATGRSDFPNQVNNALCFPYLFRGALDARARRITEPMQIAAANALAALARETVPESVLSAYNITELEFSKNYIIPKPLDPRLREYISSRVAAAWKEK
jgi:malate dehydrogenase (oxaloacetate-decarboxylating)(NADP+)